MHTERPQRPGYTMPRNYKRSDERIQEDLCDRLYHCHELDVGEVGIEVKGGIVTLTGGVPYRWMKHRIEDLAAQCMGVADVENRIQVRRDAGKSFGDKIRDTIASAADIGGGPSQATAHARA
jgi:osmotically-inducible protein OsmY